MFFKQKYYNNTKIDKKFILHEFNKDVVHIDDGYFVVEYTPRNQYYNS